MLDSLNQTEGQISHSLADLVIGTIVFDGMNRETRVLRLTALIELYKATMVYGELEHASDWDWRIEVVWGDAEIKAGTYDVGIDPDGYDAVWSDTIRLNYETRPEDYTEHFSRWHYLAIDEFRPVDDDHIDDVVEVLVPIDEIRSITIGEA